MPEQLTKYPDVTLLVLRSAGATCGEGAPQAILTQCPASRFCKLPGGELCVYGLPEALKMTQISPAEWQAVLPARPPPPAAPASAASAGPVPGDGLVGGAIGLLAGVALSAVVSRWRRRGH